MWQWKRGEIALSVARNTFPDARTASENGALCANTPGIILNYCNVTSHFILHLPLSTATVRSKVGSFDTVQLKARKEASLRQVLIRSEGNNSSSNALIDKAVNRDREIMAIQYESI